MRHIEKQALILISGGVLCTADHMPCSGCAPSPGSYFVEGPYYHQKQTLPNASTFFDATLLKDNSKYILESEHRECKPSSFS